MIQTTIKTTPTHSGRCEFCTLPARWRSQQVDASGEPLRRAVLTCRQHKLNGRLLAEQEKAVEVEET